MSPFPSRPLPPWADTLPLTNCNQLNWPDEVSILALCSVSG